MPLHRQPSPLARRRRTAVAWWLALLLAAQWLALSHGVAHGAGHDHPHAHDHAALFDDHEADSAQCRLIDGSAQALAAPPAPVVVEPLAGAHATARPPALPPRAAAHWGLPQARAPPLA